MKEKPKEVIGNYIRIILEDNKEHIVENVEDYLKLDDGAPQMQDLDMEKFLYSIRDSVQETQVLPLRSRLPYFQ